MGIAGLIRAGKGHFPHIGMQSPKLLRLLTAGDKLVPSAEFTGLLFECAPDSFSLMGCPNRLELRDLIGDFDETKKLAFVLARKLLAGEPAFRGVQQLGIFEEVVIRELQYAFHLIHLYKTGVNQGVQVCRFDSPSRWADGLAAVAKIRGGSIKVESGSRRARGGSLVRSLRRLAKSRLSLQSLREEFWQAKARIDPFRRCAGLVRRFRKCRYEPHGIWFYSTAHTFTRIGLSYEPYFPEAFNYLIENPLTGGKALYEAGRSYFRLYDFGAKETEPSPDELSVAASEIDRHIRSVPLSGDEAAVRDIFIEGEWFRQFLRKHLPSGLFQSALFGMWADAVSPAALVVGNPVFEGYALHAAKRKGVPTVLLQHGILGDFCQFWDPPVDRYIVRGRFWRDFLSPPARAKSAVLNVPARVTAATAVKAPIPAKTKHILFITAPYSMQEFWHLADLDDIFLVLLRVSAASRRRLVVRVHPLEKVNAYRSLVARLIEGHGAGAQVSYSQGPGLEEMVADAAVAITYASTTFLDCLRLRVPIVGLDWHDFSYKKKIHGHRVFHFAEGLGHLHRLIVAGIAGKLGIDAKKISDFLAPDSADALTTYFATLSAEAPEREGLESQKCL